MGRVPPMRVISWDWMARNSFTCGSMGISPISSSISVPWLAYSNRPTLPLVLAPVKAPFSYPRAPTQQMSQD